MHAWARSAEQAVAGCRSRATTIPAALPGGAWMICLAGPADTAGVALPELLEEQPQGAMGLVHAQPAVWPAACWRLSAWGQLVEHLGQG